MPSTISISVFPKHIKVFYYLSAMLLIAGILIHLYTFIPGVPALPKYWLFILFVGVFITFLPAVRCANALIGGEFRQDMWKIALAPLARWHRAALVALFAYMIFNFLFTLLYLNRGFSAEVVNGRYELQSKGHFVKHIDAPTYHLYRNREARGMTGHAIMFQAISGALLLSALRKRDQKIIRDRG